MIRYRKFYNVLLIWFFLIINLSLFAQWPKGIPLKNGGKITIYQPQPENFKGDTIIGRAAISVKKSEKEELIFGAIFFTAKVTTNRDNRTALLESVQVTDAKFPGVEDTSKLHKLSDIIESEVPKWNQEISLDALVASIQLENAGNGTDQFKNDPPRIIYKQRPTTLVIIDGAPKIQKDKKLDADRVVNTPYLIFQEGKQWNMYTGGVWYKSDSITKYWSPNRSLSKKLQSVNEQIKKKEDENNGGRDSSAIPQVTDILVSTVPAEIIQTSGEASYKSIQGTYLLYVSNTYDDIFKDINSQKFFVLLAGRWYSSESINGDWSYTASDKLPADFAKIPEGSEKDNVLANVAGTAAATEAKMDAQIPQTAKIDRKTATVKVEFDGNPQFKAIEGTSLQLAENANITVMKAVDGKYYALDNGVWFIADAPNGPWIVSDQRPSDIEKIPASSAAYNTKYVYIYESTPEYVYAGYTPGYMGCYVYGSTIVYGTGYAYPPWYGSIFFPLPMTWGFGFSYNPWMGWGMGFSYGMGFMTVGIGFSVGFYGGWFGPPMYYPPYRPYYGGGGYYGHGGGNHINNGNINRINHNNIYNNHKGVTTKDVNRGGNRGKVNEGLGNNRPSARPANGKNNVYADRNGNAYQRDNKGGWNQRDNQTGKWNQSARDNSSLNQASQNRDRGTMHQNNFQQSNRSFGGGSPGGGMRGGGGRRGR